MQLVISWELPPCYLCGSRKNHAGSDSCEQSYGCTASLLGDGSWSVPPIPMGCGCKGEAGTSEWSICLWASSGDCTFEDWSQESVPTKWDVYEANFTLGWPESSQLIDQPAPGWIGTHCCASTQLSPLDALEGGCARSGCGASDAVSWSKSGFLLCSFRMEDTQCRC